MTLKVTQGHQNCLYSVNFSMSYNCFCLPTMISVYHMSSALAKSRATYGPMLLHDNESSTYSETHKARLEKFLACKQVKFDCTSEFTRS